MASMTTEFFKVKLFDASNGKELDYKMIQLLSLIHVPRKKYSEKQIKDMKQQIFKNGD